MGNVIQRTASVSHQHDVDLVEGTVPYSTAQRHRRSLTNDGDNADDDDDDDDDGPVPRNALKQSSRELLPKFPANPSSDEHSFSAHGSSSGDHAIATSSRIPSGRRHRGAGLDLPPSYEDDAGGSYGHTRQRLAIRNPVLGNTSRSTIHPPPPTPGAGPFQNATTTVQFLWSTVVTTSYILVLLTLVGLISTLLTNAYRPSKYRLDRLAFPWVNRPQNYLRPFDPNFPTDYNVLLEGHSHTTLSDGDMTPQQLVEFYRASGFNALIVSDHNTVAGGLAAEKYAQEHYPDSFLVIPAQEYSCCRIHMNLINIRETIPVTSAFPSNTELKRVIEQTHALGGLVVVNHIPWSNKTETDYNPVRPTSLAYDETSSSPPEGPSPTPSSASTSVSAAGAGVSKRETQDKFHESVTGNYATLPGHPTRSELLELGIDGIEIMNGPVFDTISYQRFFQSSPSASNNIKEDPAPRQSIFTTSAVSSSSAALFAITGNDIHHPGPVYSWTVLKSANFSTAAILDELRHRRTSFLVEPSGTRQTAALTYNPAYLWLAPLVAIADYFTAFYDRQRGMYSFTGAFCQPERVSFHLAALVGLVFYIFITVAAVRLGRSYCQRHSLSNWREWLRRGRH
ncbi:hypothetical protein H4R33_002867 [Dimargaris cristalligena]|nr:hypothetical protein H4R33_002867 [Dimargaris cristalligena]